ncbi:MAG: RNA-binding domain-containing protein [Candidatus Heimdallarchaeaceae archaeon]
MNITISIKIPLFPTETKEKVLKCFERLLGSIPKVSEIEEHSTLYLVADNVPIKKLEKIFNLIREQQILDTVRNCADIDYSTNSLIFYLHKQALYSGKIAIITSDTTSPLGQVELHIRNKDPKEILDWIAPKTVDGREIKKTVFDDVYKL